MTTAQPDGHVLQTNLDGSIRPPKTTAQMPRRVTVHNRKRVFDGFFKLEEAEVSYERFDGEMTGKVKRLSLERGDSVAAVVFNTDSRTFLLANQFRYPTCEKGPGWITETVAGMIEGDESPEDAVRREILEETGFAARRLEPISTFYVSPGGSSERIVLFYAEVDESTRHRDGGGVESEGEDIMIVEMPLEAAEKALADGEVVDAKTIIGLTWALNRLPG